MTASTFRSAGYSFLPWIALLLLWQALAAFFPPVILPGPGETLSALVKLLFQADFYLQLWATAWRGLVGFGGALLFGVLLGLLMGWRQAIYRSLHPLTTLLLNLPPIAWIALLLIWFGLGNWPPLMVVLATTTPLVAVNVAQGVREFDPALLEMAQAFQFSRQKKLRHLLLPALGGRIFAAALLALGFTWRSLVMAEFLGSTSGLGYRLSWARQNLDTENMLAYLVVIVLMSSSLEYGLRRIYQTTRAWEQGPHPASGSYPHRHGREQHLHPPLPLREEKE